MKIKETILGFLNNNRPVRNKTLQSEIDVRDAHISALETYATLLQQHVSDDVIQMSDKFLSDKILDANLIIFGSNVSCSNLHFDTDSQRLIVHPNARNVNITTTVFEKA